jgi:hypothetical protein
MSTDYAARVARGAALLDRVRPGWACEVAADRLAMESCDRCILGQLYGEYSLGFWTLTRPLDARKLFSAADHGFTLHASEQAAPDADTFARFARLADAWRAAIRERLKGA